MRGRNAIRFLVYNAARAIGVFLDIDINFMIFVDILKGVLARLEQIIADNTIHIDRANRRIVAERPVDRLVAALRNTIHGGRNRACTLFDAGVNVVRGRIVSAGRYTRAVHRLGGPQRYNHFHIVIQAIDNNLIAVDSALFCDAIHFDDHRIQLIAIANVPLYRIRAAIFQDSAWRDAANAAVQRCRNRMLDCSIIIRRINLGKDNLHRMILLNGVEIHLAIRRIICQGHQSVHSSRGFRKRRQST